MSHIDTDSAPEGAHKPPSGDASSVGTPAHAYARCGHPVSRGYSQHYAHETEEAYALRTAIQPAVCGKRSCLMAMYR